MPSNTYFLSIAGVDYNNTISILLLSNKTVTMAVELYDDNSMEGDEDLEVILQTMDFGKNIVLSKETAIVTIVDDDSKSSL